MYNPAISLMPKRYGHCAYCGNFRVLTRDHVFPKSKRSKGDCEILLMACGYVALFSFPFVSHCVTSWCNFDKGNQLLEEWLQSFEPWMPQHVLVPKFIDMPPEEIKRFKEAQLKESLYIKKGQVMTREEFLYQ